MTFPIDTSVTIAADAVSSSVWSIEHSTVVKESDNGLVETNPRWPRGKKNWTLGWIANSAVTVENLFRVNGPHAGFLFVPSRLEDYVATGQTLGTGNGVKVAFQLTLTATTVARSVVQNILYPLAGTVVIKLNGTPTAAFTVNLTTGIVTMTSAPGSGVVVTADFQYATPVRFTADKMDVTVFQNDRQETRSVAIEEVF
jgi:uncharacterized protein (TIGR02217 family)